MEKRLRMPARRDLSELALRSLALLCQRRFSAEGLAGALGVSVITAKRLVASLRAGGYRVSTVRRGGGAWYDVCVARSRAQLERDPLWTGLSEGAPRERPSRKAEDADYDRD